MESSMSGMSMAMSTTAAPTSTMSGMSMSMSGMPSSTMSGMSHSPTDGSMSMSSSMMGMDSMAMTFFSSASTPLFAWSWTPATVGQYAGTCIFLIAFAAIFRALLAIRVRFYEFFALVKYGRSNYLEKGSPSEARRSRPWRASEAVALAGMDVVLAGVGYLLMIAVMTMNVGYFLSVLAGVFLGSLAFGHLMAGSAAQMC